MAMVRPAVMIEDHCDDGHAIHGHSFRDAGSCWVWSGLWWRVRRLPPRYKPPPDTENVGLHHAGQQAQRAQTMGKMKA